MGARARDIVATWHHPDTGVLHAVTSDDRLACRSTVAVDRADTFDYRYRWIAQCERPGCATYWKATTLW